MDPHIKQLVPGDVVSQRYEIREVLGVGGYGTVYGAFDRASERDVAVKVVQKTATGSPVTMQRFEREVSLQRSLHHPNIVQVYDNGVSETGAHYIVLEYVRGCSVAALLQQSTRLALADVSSILLQTASGLRCAHSAGVIHRDLTPANILITKDGLVKIADFGVAYELGSQQKLTRTNEIIACTYYSSIEQLMCTTVDETSDLYALGMVAYKMVTGEEPFQAETVYELRRKHLEEPLPAIGIRRPETPPGLVAIIEKLSAKRREDRFQSAQEVVFALESLSASSPDGLRSTHRTTRAFFTDMTAVGTALAIAIVLTMALPQWWQYLFDILFGGTP